jgi:apolipoprotein N-acyltransferase
MTRRRWWLLALGAAAAGAVWGLCFTRTSHTWLGWLALAPLFLFLDLPRPGWLAFWHGMGFWVTSLWWIRGTMGTYGQLDPVTATLAILAVGVFQGSYTGLFGALGARLWKHPSWLPAFAGLPALWVAVEWLKGYGPPGFPWNLAAYAWVDMPGALPLSGWVGAWGVSFLIVLANNGLAISIARRRAWPAVAGVLLAALALAAGGRWGRGPDVPAPAPGAGLEVRLLQPDLPILVEWDAVKVRANYESLLAMSRAACDTPGAIVFWPESAAWPYSLQRDPQLRADVAALVAAGCPVIVNFDFDTGDGVRNGVALVDGGGWEKAPRQDKRHLVPFGEYVPLREVIPFLNKLARNAGEFATGDRVVLLPAGSERFGMSVCYEIVFPGEVAEQVAAGATVLTTVTNDGWYGDTSAPWQHFRAARFRAAENRRPLLRAALTGVSGVVGADGRVLAELGPGERGVLRARVVGRSDRSPFSRAPWLVPLLAALGAGAAIAFVIIRR